MTLRWEYQAVAASASRRAAGWNLFRFIRATPELFPDRFPWDQLDFAVLDLFDSPLNFGCPGHFDAGIRLALEAFQEPSGEFCTVVVSCEASSYKSSMRRFMLDILTSASTSRLTPFETRSCL